MPLKTLDPSTAAARADIADPGVKPEIRVCAPDPARRSPIRLVIADPIAADARRTRFRLRRAGRRVIAQRIDTRDELSRAIEGFRPDVVLTEYELSDFDALTALQTVADKCPGLPVIVVTGALGDEAAAALVEAGAADYVLKDRLARLPAAVERAVAHAGDRRARRKAEQELEYANIIVEQSPVVLFRSLAKEGFPRVYVSRNISRFGYTAEEAKTEAFQFPDYVYPEDRPAVAAALERLMDGNAQVFDLDYRVVARDGSIRWIQDRTIPLRDDRGLIVAFQGTLIEVTERKQAEAALRASHAMLTRTERIAAVGGWDWDPRGEAVVWSEEVFRMFGLDPASFRPTLSGFIEFVHADDRQRVRDAITAALAGAREFDTEFRILRPDGTERIVHARAEVARGPAGEPVRMTGTSHDITERKKMERERALNAAVLAAEHDTSPDGILVVDPQRSVLSFNRRFCEMWGISAQSLISMSPAARMQTVLDKVADPEGFAARAEALYAHTEEKSYDQIRFNDGRVFERYSAAMLHERAGEYLGRVWFFRDISDRKQAERALQRMNRALRTLSSGNAVLVHADSEPELLREMCRVMVEAGGYRMAWIGEARQDAGKTIAPIAWAGVQAGYFEQARFSWADGPCGQAPSGRAIRTGEPQTSQDLAADPRMQPWRAAANAHGFVSAAALPLRNHSGVFAVLVIYAAEPEAFDTDELKLLCELATDLSYGIRALHDRAERENAVERWRTSLEAAIGAIAGTVEQRDPYTAGHQQRVAQLAVAIARDLGMSEDQVHGISLAGIIHDVGKIHIPAEILCKPGKLTSLEYQLIQEHPQVGYDIVKGVDFPWPIAETVLQHHERLDGSGYPNGLRGDAIRGEAKILAVADVVEAMMSRRPYREALGLDAALAEIERGKRRLYDPAAVDACVQMFRQNRFVFR